MSGTVGSDRNIYKYGTPPDQDHTERLCGNNDESILNVCCTQFPVEDTYLNWMSLCDFEF